ncbi:hypothetical protein KKG52_01955 [Patescibacteria group bacterium]|nr:hypothetical protein [Patescibacteria group bacterium]
MKKLFKNILKDKIVQKSYLITFLIIIISFLYSLFYYFRLPPFIPLYNQLPWGEKRLGTTMEIFIPSIITVFIFLFNFSFSSVIYNKAPLLSRMISVTSLLFAILVFLFLIRTIQIVL